MNNIFKSTIFFFFFTSTIYSQNTIDLPKPSPSATIQQKIGHSDFTIKYSRPSKKERDIFGSLVPFDVRWRTGANERTSLSVSTSFVIGKDSIPAGDYAIFTIPHKESWDFIIYSEHEGWGALRWDESKIVSKTNHKVKTLANTVESFTIDFKNLQNPNVADLHLSWENTSVSVAIKLPTQKISNKKIEEFINPHELNYRIIIIYYLQNDIKLDEVISLSDKVISIAKGSVDGFWGYHFKAMAYRKLNRNQEKDLAIKNGIEYVNGLDAPKEDKEWLINVLQENKMM